MENLTVHSLVESATDYFRVNGYTESSVLDRERILQQIANIHDSVGITYLSQVILNQYIDRINSQYNGGYISRIYYRFINKTVNYLLEFKATGEMRLARQFITSVSDYYDEVLAGILEYTGWNRKSSHSVWSVAKTYFNWLVANGHEDLSSVTPDVVKMYLIDCAARLNGSSLDTIRCVIKKLCIYLFQQGLCPDSCERLFSFAVPTPRSIKRIIPQEEIALTLSAIDRETDIGKRDYATILLAVVTGLRATDISNLKLSDIDWRNGEIKIIQSKTGNSLALPLTTDAGYAIRNYIENARPESDIKNVFLRSRSPVTGITPAILYGQYNIYRARVGLPKSSFHSLRRTLGTNMVITGTPVTTVSQTLGHKELNSTRRYISLDTKNLGECALDFTGIEPETRKRGVV